MRIVETLLVRDEIDVIDAHLAFQLSAGVDFVVAIDHDSKDGTKEVLERYVRDGYLHRIQQRGTLREVEWRTQMARLAVTQHGADWVINADADQFWWPRDGDLQEVLSAVPTNVGAIHAFDRAFVARPFDGAHFAERMIYRLSPPASINAPASTYRPVTRVIHRGDAGVVVSLGNHAITGAALPGLQHWHPIEVLHYPWRSPEQMARKATHFVHARASDATAYHSEAYRFVTEERSHAHYSALAIDDDALERGRAKGLIAVDTRVRDTLRSLGGKAGFGAQPDGYAPDRRWPHAASRHPAVDDAAYAAEAESLRQAALVRARRRLDSLERRLRPLQRVGRA